VTRAKIRRMDNKAIRQYIDNLGEERAARFMAAQGIEEEEARKVVHRIMQRRTSYQRRKRRGQ